MLIEENHYYKGISYEFRKAWQFFVVFFFHNAKMDIREKLSYDASRFLNKS